MWWREHVFLFRYLKGTYPISEYKSNFKGALTFISVEPEHGHMEIKFQLLMPGFNYDLSHPGRDKSHGWFFFSTYNTEEANSLLEVNASQNDKDFIAAVNWKMIEAYVNNGGGKKMSTRYAHNVYDESTHTATSTMNKEVLTVDPAEVPGAIYFLPTPKSPHGCDVDPTGQYIIGSGKLSADLTVHSFDKMLAAIKAEKFDGEAYGIPILNYQDVLAGTVSSGGLGPLHTEFDGRGNAYTTFFISSEVVKWELGTWEVIDRKPTYYSVGHLMIPGGNSRKPHGKYLVAMNKITKDRYLPTGPEMEHSAQIYDITGEKWSCCMIFRLTVSLTMRQVVMLSFLVNNSKKIYRLDENNHPTL